MTFYIVKFYKTFGHPLYFSFRSYNSNATVHKELQELPRASRTSFAKGVLIEGEMFGTDCRGE